MVKGGGSMVRERKKGTKNERREESKKEKEQNIRK